MSHYVQISLTSVRPSHYRDYFTASVLSFTIIFDVVQVEDPLNGISRPECLVQSTNIPPVREYSIPPTFTRWLLTIETDDLQALQLATTYRPIYPHHVSNGSSFL